jgi:hypothetical protein
VALRRPAYRFALLGQAALDLAADGRPAGLFAPDLGLAGGQPGGFPGLRPLPAPVGDGQVAQVHDVPGQEHRGDREPGPEARAGDHDAEQLGEVEQDQAGEDSPAAVDGGRVAPRRPAAL